MLAFVRQNTMAFAILAVLLLTSSANCADVWPIQFGLLEGHKPHGYRKIRDWALKWNLWPSTGRLGGSEIENQTGVTIVAIHIKVDKDHHPNDTFQVDASSGGMLFTEVWKKTDNTEVILNGGNIPDGDSFWSLVPRTNGDRFLGKASSKPITPPSDGKWVKLTSKFAAEATPLWKDLIAACPAKYRDIKVYGSSTDEKKVCFVSGNRLLLFDLDSKTIRPVLTEEEIGRQVNRITVEGKGSDQTFILWWNGTEMARIPFDAIRLDEPVGRKPESKPRQSRRDESG